MVDKNGMMRLRRKREKSREKSVLQDVCVYFDKLVDFVTDKVVNQNYALVSGDEKSINDLNDEFTLEYLTFEYKSIKYRNNANKHPFYLLKKDDIFRKSIEWSKINDSEFGNIVADKLVLMLMQYNEITDHVTVGTRHTKGQSIEDARLIIKDIFAIPEDIMDQFKDRKKLNLMRGLMVKGAMNNVVSNDRNSKY